MPRDYAPPAASWKPYTSWSLEKLNPPIFGPRQAVMFGSHIGTTRPSTSWNSVGVKIRGSARKENLLQVKYLTFAQISCIIIIEKEKRSW